MNTEICLIVLQKMEHQTVNNRGYRANLGDTNDPKLRCVRAQIGGDTLPTSGCYRTNGRGLPYQYGGVMPLQPIVNKQLFALFIVVSVLKFLLFLTVRFRGLQRQKNAGLPGVLKTLQR